MFQVTENWRTSHTGGAVGLLSVQVDRSQENQAALDQERIALENQLREQFQGVPRAEIRKLPVMNAYAQYYKRFKKSYHLLLQLDSICNKNRSIPHFDPLVQAMFMAEMRSFILTAGHDLDRISGLITLDSASGEETYTMLNGKHTTCKAGDMTTADTRGVICSIIYGQDSRTQIKPDTREVVYVVYVPPMIDDQAVQAHLDDLERLVELAFPGMQRTSKDIYRSGPPDISEENQVAVDQ